MVDLDIFARKMDEPRTGLGEEVEIDRSGIVCVWSRVIRNKRKESTIWPECFVRASFAPLSLSFPQNDEVKSWKTLQQRTAIQNNKFSPTLALW